MKIRSLAALVVGATLALGAPSAATASTSPDMQGRIDAVLADYPGGVQTDWNEVTWDNGATVLTLADETNPIAAASVGGCQSGAFCAFSQAGYLGSKITFTTCSSSNSVSALGAPVRSIANSRTSGTVTAKNGTTVVATVAAGTGKNITATVTTLSCA